MESFSKNEIGQIFVLRLVPGDYILESIMDMIEKENIKDGVVISAIGTFSDCTLHMVTTTGFPPVEHFEEWKDKPLELASVQGIIADGTPHLHAVISDKDKAYAGHLEKKCRVLYLAEIVIIEVKNLNLKRIPGEKDILKLTSQKDK